MAQRAYFGLNFVLSLILAIFPVTCWVLGVVICFQREQYGFAVLRIFFGWLIWIVDIISMCVKKDIVWLA